MLEDIDAAGFPERRRDPGPGGIDACLRWLAAFHARFLGVAPDGLWKNGTYWHLATRQDELAAIEDPELREAAPLLDQKLRACVFQTLVHGDAKPANFCFARGGSSVAAVDFQYVGGGCGMKDVAYLLSDEPGRRAMARRLLRASARRARRTGRSRGGRARVARALSDRSRRLPPLPRRLGEGALAKRPPRAAAHPRRPACALTPSAP